MNLSKIVILSINGLCLIIEIFFLNDVSVKSCILISSKVISSSLVSEYLSNKLNIVDLPLSLLPTIAIFLFGSNFKLKLFKVFFYFF